MDHTCREIQELIPVYLKNEISQENRQKVEEHIRICEECSRFLDSSDQNPWKMSSLEETHTKADTFQGSEKRQKSKLVYFLVGIILVIAAIGVISYQMGAKSQDGLFSLKEVCKALESNGLELTLQPHPSGSDLELGGVIPSIYQVDSSEDTILVYVFESVGERRDINEKSEIRPDLTVYRPARNLLLAYQVTIPETQEEYEIIKPALDARLKKYNDTVLFNLNQGLTKVYSGCSENWQGEITISYYLYWYQNEQDMTCLDSYTWKKGFLRYTGTDQELSNFSYEYNATPGGGGRSAINTYHGKDIMINEEGSGAVIPDFYHVRTCWNDQEEEFDLTVRGSTGD